MKASLIVPIPLPLWVHFRYCKCPVALPIQLQKYTLKWKDKRGWVMKPHLVTRGLLFCCCSWSLPVLSAHKQDYFIRVQASSGSVTSFTLCSLLFTSIAPSLFPSFTLLSSSKASNSMVKYPDQCVAFQRDSGSRYAGIGPESKWRVIVARCGYTSYRP